MAVFFALAKEKEEVLDWLENAIDKKHINKHRVRYCIIGSYAVAFYARPRYTKYIEIFIEPTAENSIRVVRALKAFGFESLWLSERDFRRKKKIIQLGYEPLRIDLLTPVERFSFRRIWKNERRGSYGREKVYFIGQSDKSFLL